MAIVVITGTPGSGKSTVASKVASMVDDSELVGVNELIKSRHIFSSYAKDGAMIVNMQKLQREIDKLVKKNKGKTLILDGHLLCDLKIKGAVVFVIREHLVTLRNRLLKRRYGMRKIKDNLVSEALDYCGERASLNYGRVFELLNTNATPSRIISILKNAKGKKSMHLDMLQELPGLMREKGWRVL